MTRRPIRRRNVCNPPDHLVRDLEDWLALDARSAEAFDEARRAALPEPSPEELDAEEEGSPDHWRRIVGDR